MPEFVNGYVTLAGEFPPSLNTEEDPTRLKPFESPDCYGVDIAKDGRLKTGSAPTGTARTSPAGTGGYTAWSWYYNRLWSASGAVLTFGSPDYRNVYYRQGLGEINAAATIITFMPCFGSSMWVATASGSQIITNVDRTNGDFEAQQFYQELSVPVAGCALTVGGIPIVLNANGIFSLAQNGEVAELTRAVRNSLGGFAYSASATDGIRADYEKKRVVGYDGAVAKCVIDVPSGKLLDYTTSGFRFTTRTLAQVPSYRPFKVHNIALLVEHADTAGGTVEWETKIEDSDWFTEDPIEIQAWEGQYSRIEAPINRESVTGHRFAVRLTSLSSNIYIREIQVNVEGLAHGSFSE